MTGACTPITWPAALEMLGWSLLGAFLAFLVFAFCLMWMLTRSGEKRQETAHLRHWAP